MNDYKKQNSNIKTEEKINRIANRKTAPIKKVITNRKATVKEKRTVYIDDIEQLISIGDDYDEVILLKPAVSRYAYKMKKQVSGPIDIARLKCVYISRATKDYDQGKNLDTITLSKKDVKALLAT